jgi:predicted glycosyltransferase involved in capsule biosynthesis
MSKKKFTHVYVLANGSRLAHALARECRINTVNFVYVNDVKKIRHCDNDLFLLDDSFSKHKNYSTIKDTLDKLKETVILSVQEFKEKISYEAKEGF